MTTAERERGPVLIERGDRGEFVRTVGGTSSMLSRQDVEGLHAQCAAYGYPVESTPAAPNNRPKAAVVQQVTESWVHIKYRAPSGLERVEWIPRRDFPTWYAVAK